jgi:hypothetical protein
LSNFVSEPSPWISGDIVHLFPAGTVPGTRIRELAVWRSSDFVLVVANGDA